MWIIDQFIPRLWTYYCSLFWPSSSIPGSNTVRRKRSSCFMMDDHGSTILDEYKIDAFDAIHFKLSEWLCNFFLYEMIASHFVFSHKHAYALVRIPTRYPSTRNLREFRRIYDYLFANLRIFVRKVLHGNLKSVLESRILVLLSLNRAMESTLWIYTDFPL